MKQICQPVPLFWSYQMIRVHLHTYFISNTKYLMTFQNSISIYYILYTNTRKRTDTINRLSVTHKEQSQCVLWALCALKSPHLQSPIVAAPLREVFGLNLLLHHFGGHLVNNGHCMVGFLSAFDPGGWWSSRSGFSVSVCLAGRRLHQVFEPQFGQRLLGHQLTATSQSRKDISVMN